MRIPALTPLVGLLLAPTALGKSFEDGYGRGPTTPLDYPFEQIAGVAPDGRSYDLEFGLRGRSLSLPKGLLDNYYADESDPAWPWVAPRPEIGGFAAGFELVAHIDRSNAIFFVEYADANLKQGYWDDVSDDDPLNGNFMVPSKGVGMVAFGANYAYEVPIVSLDQTGHRFELCWMIGGGLGAGILTGTIEKWGIDAAGNPGYQRFLAGEPPDNDSRLPRVFPILDASSGVRLNFGNSFVVRLEGGLHTLLYYGASAGVRF